MKRRTVLKGSAGLTLAAGAGAYLWRPEDLGEPHDAYFSALNTLLRNEGPGRPVMLLDLARINQNIDNIKAMVGASKTYRIVVKSLPSIPLLRYTMGRADTKALMLFHQPFLNEVAEEIPDADVLFGKPMPIAAVKLFYQKLAKNSLFNPQTQVQWLIDTPERLEQYQQLAKQLGVKMRINFELDLGLHRGGFEDPRSIQPMLETIKGDSAHLEFSGYMGYEPHLKGSKSPEEPAVKEALDIYRGFIAEANTAGYDSRSLTLNGAGSHTVGMYGNDEVMNDLSAGSGVVKPVDFDSYHLNMNSPALFIASPILKRYDSLKIPGAPAELGNLMSLWDPNMQRVYYIYGGYWKARVVSPGGVPEPIYQSTNQSPYTTSQKVDLKVDDYLFFRPTQSEFVMLQFGDLLVVDDNKIVDSWPVFQQTG